MTLYKSAGHQEISGKTYKYGNKEGRKWLSGNKNIHDTKRAIYERLTKKMKLVFLLSPLSPLLHFNIHIIVITLLYEGDTKGPFNHPAPL